MAIIQHYCTVFDLKNVFVSLLNKSADLIRRYMLPKYQNKCQNFLNNCFHNFLYPQSSVQKHESIKSASRVWSCYTPTSFFQNLKQQSQIEKLSNSNRDRSCWRWRVAHPTKRIEIQNVLKRIETQNVLKRIQKR